MAEDQTLPQAAKNKTIGQVLSQLDAEFPGISASKIRFLEDKGLVHPQRTNTGYRKYSAQDIAQLRYILTLQRDQYLPLKVIKERVDSGAAFGEPQDSPVDQKVQTPTDQSVGEPVAPSVLTDVNPTKTYTLLELSEATGAERPLLRELINFGLIQSEDGHYDEYDVVVTNVCSELTAHGLHPRHLRPFKAQAEREIGLVESVVAPIASRKDENSQARAAARAAEVAQLCLRLHMALVASNMPTYQSPSAE